MAAGHFEAKYAADADPWGFRSDPAERARLADIVRSLPNRRYRSAFEAGCSNGELTALLALRCDAVLAMDGSFTACRAAAERLQGYEQVAVRCGDLPGAWPVGPFDLVVVSELAYYFSPGGVDELAELCCRSLAPGGQVCLVNWHGVSDDMLCTGQDVRRRFRQRLPVVLRSIERPGYSIDILGCPQ